jgi:hypothetical protein
MKQTSHKPSGLDPHSVANRVDVIDRGAETLPGPKMTPDNCDKHTTSKRLHAQ